MKFTLLFSYGIENLTQTKKKILKKLNKINSIIFLFLKIILVHLIMSFSRRLVNDLKGLTDMGVPFYYSEEESSKTNVFYCLFSDVDDNSLYYGNKFVIRIEVTEGYPLKSPSVSFSDFKVADEDGNIINCGGGKLYHPNIHFKTGAICVDTLNQKWTPTIRFNSIMYTIQMLLCNPNPEDPYVQDDCNPAEHYTQFLKDIEKYGKTSPLALKKLEKYEEYKKQHPKDVKTIEHLHLDYLDVVQREATRIGLETDDFIRNHSYIKKVHECCKLYSFKGESFENPLSFLKEKNEDITKDTEANTETDEETDEERLQREQIEADHLMAIAMQYD